MLSNQQLVGYNPSQGGAYLSTDPSAGQVIDRSNPGAGTAGNGQPTSSPQVGNGAPMSNLSGVVAAPPPATQDPNATWWQGNGPQAAQQAYNTSAAQLANNPPIPGAQQGGSSAGGFPNFTSGMTPDQVRAAVTQYYAAKGVTPLPTSIDYWVQKYQEFGNSDPSYFTTRLGQADEFGGGHIEGGASGGASGGSSGGGSSWQQTPISWGGAGGGPGSIDGGGFSGTFTAPTAEQAAATPGYQFTFDQGLKALQNSQFAKGNALGGGAAKALVNYGEGMASTNYQQTYQNAMNEYLNSYNIFRNNQNDSVGRNQFQQTLGEKAATDTAA